MLVTTKSLIKGELFRNSKKVTGSIPRATCRGLTVSVWLLQVLRLHPHSPKTCASGQVARLKRPKLWMWVRSIVVWLCDDLATCPACSSDFKPRLLGSALTLSAALLIEDGRMGEHVLNLTSTSKFHRSFQYLITVRSKRWQTRCRLRCEGSLPRSQRVKPGAN